MEVVATGRRFPHRQAGANMALPISLARSLLPQSSCFQPLAEGPTGGVNPTSGRTASIFRSPRPRLQGAPTQLPRFPPARLPHTSSSRAPGSGTLWRTLRSQSFSVPRPDRALLMDWTFPCRQVLAVTMRSLQGLSPEQVTTRNSVSMACTESPAPCIWKFRRWSGWTLLCAPLLPCKKAPRGGMRDRPAIQRFLARTVMYLAVLQ